MCIFLTVDASSLCNTRIPSTSGIQNVALVVCNNSETYSSNRHSYECKSGEGKEREVGKLSEQISRILVHRSTVSEHSFIKWKLCHMGICNREMRFCPQSNVRKTSETQPYEKPVAYSHHDRYIITSIIIIHTTVLLPKYLNTHYNHATNLIRKSYNRNSNIQNTSLQAINTNSANTHQYNQIPCAESTLMQAVKYNKNLIHTYKPTRNRICLFIKKLVGSERGGRATGTTRSFAYLPLPTCLS